MVPDLFMKYRFGNYVADNNIGDNGATTLGRCLPFLSKLTVLDIRREWGLVKKAKLLRGRGIWTRMIAQKLKKNAGRLPLANFCLQTTKSERLA